MVLLTTLYHSYQIPLFLFLPLMSEAMNTIGPTTANNHATSIVFALKFRLPVALDIKVAIPQKDRKSKINLASHLNRFL